MKGYLHKAVGVYIHGYAQGVVMNHVIHCDTDSGHVGVQARNGETFSLSQGCTSGAMVLHVCQAERRRR